MASTAILRSQSHGAHVVVADEAAFGVDAVARFCRQRLAVYKVPSVFKIESNLPRNATGKVRKNLLVATVG
ncbi:hypothetical protein ACFLIM_42520 [Nonomuraea sp. M3C6]|uniref:AMP-binding enzyme C-terminal domain-containing protein n=1 Tax=Nonomuraea marmarensis TaxID=3351344 RepID=A0ABW7AR55_9ACTN